jgi:hypothetical protein
MAKTFRDCVFLSPLPWYHHGKNLKTSKPCFPHCHGITMAKTFPAPSFLSRCHGNHHGKNPSTSKPCFASPPPVFCSTAMVSPWQKPSPLPVFCPTAMVITMAKTHRPQNRVLLTAMVSPWQKPFPPPVFCSTAMVITMAKTYPLPFFFPTAMVITMAKTYQLQNRVSPTTMVITMAKTFLAPSFLSHCHGNHHGKNPSTSKPCLAHCHGITMGKTFPASSFLSHCHGITMAKTFPAPSFLSHCHGNHLAKTHQPQNRVLPTAMVITMAKTFFATSFLSNCYGNHDVKKPGDACTRLCFYQVGTPRAATWRGTVVASRADFTTSTGECLHGQGIYSVERSFVFKQPCEHKNCPGVTIGVAQGGCLIKRDEEQDGNAFSLFLDEARLR